MTMRDTIITKLHNLPEPLLQQVNDFIDFVSLKNQNQTVDSSSQEHISEAWKQWFKANAEPQHESDKLAEVEKILRETEGSWGHLTLDEIDAQLARQRLFDWDE
jgi:hypothetical protein